MLVVGLMACDKGALISCVMRGLAVGDGCMMTEKAAGAGCDEARGWAVGLVNKQLVAPSPPVDKFQLLPEFLKHTYIIHAKNLHLGNLVANFDLPHFVFFVNFSPHYTPFFSERYAAPIYVNIVYSNGSHGQLPVMKREKAIIGRMPIMLRSCRCVLYEKDEDELARRGECPLDPGGYFVIKGTEKVILIQEQLSKNRIIIDTDKKGCIQASVTSSTELTKSKTVIRMEKEKIYLFLNQFTTKVPIMVVMKAMGMESDQEVVQMLGRDPRYGALLLPSIEECASYDVFTQQQALDFLEKKWHGVDAIVKDLEEVVRGKIGDERQSACRLKFGKLDTTVTLYFNQEGRALGILRDILVANVPVHENNFRSKCIYVAVMLRRMMEAILNKDAVDDKDYVGNKRLELSGQLISLLFEDLFKTMNDEIRRGIDIILAKPSRSSRFDISQVVARLSFIGTLGHMTKICPQFEKSRKVSGPRALQPSQWGMLCPCDTPEGESCGLVKNLALMTHVTTDEEEGPIISLCYCLGVEDLELLSGEELHTPNSFLIILNGLILGKHRRPQSFATAMRKLRRAGKIGEFVSIFVNEKQQCVYIASDSGRVCRPLVIADKGVSRIKERHIKELKIAFYEGEAKVETTHIEIEPFTILGVCAGLIPYPHHNQSPRNTYQCAMGKQAMGNIAYNQAMSVRLQLGRLDTLIYLLVYPQRPLLTTLTIELVGYDKLGAGQNATVTVMSYSGYDIEDAIVMNKSSLDRGFGRCIVMKKLSAIYQKYENGTEDRIIRPQREGHDADRMQILDDDGLAAPGEIIRTDDIYINKESPVITSSRSSISPKGLPNSAYKPSRQVYMGPKGETAVVDRVALFSDKSNNKCFKFMIRHTRRPEVGDKFSSRHGQKGVCGTIIQQEDFPFSERGICPDLIMNPHGFPSRMTVGKMIELLGSKAGVSSGKFHYGSAFGEQSGHADRVEVISETLVKHGFSYNGKDFIYSEFTSTSEYLILKLIKQALSTCSFIYWNYWYATTSIYIYGANILPEAETHVGMVVVEAGLKPVGSVLMVIAAVAVAIVVAEVEGKARRLGYVMVASVMVVCAGGNGMVVLMVAGKVLDKMHARGNGPRVMITRQPTEGRSKNGGLRVGEMERDCLIAYGTSMLIYERLMISSDPFEVQVCRKCGLLGYYNYKLKTGICSKCKNGENISSMKLPYACKLLFQEWLDFSSFSASHGNELVEYAEARAHNPIPHWQGLWYLVPLFLAQALRWSGHEMNYED
ncbi:hypothetical protein RJ639_020678 [Escallonia herrerae]|uniref:DNA-directed RNA polymerase subunit beta n=1 Tax=Escallonia herrerae TaxID=1293975 RepID=A0AA89AF35_9ASTE|nr:hypothetical protein RJ639_020678 [Escallonia herrerae]